MAEAAGLAVGFVGLAGLFATCVDCFKLVQIHGYREADYEVLQTMLDNQQFHFMAWRKACGFMDLDSGNAKFDDVLSTDRNQRIEDTLESIQSLLTNGQKLKEIYGLKMYRTPMGAKSIEGMPLSAFSRAFRSTKAFCDTSLQRKTRIVGSFRWVFYDRERFDKLVQGLRDLIEDLENLTEDMGTKDSHRIVVEYELGTIGDESALEVIAIASACDENDDLLSRTASRRLERVREQSVSSHPVSFDDEVSLVWNGRYAPSVSTLPEDDEFEVLQEIGITKTAYADWRNVKPRAGLYFALKTLIVATGSCYDVSNTLTGMHALSGATTPYENAFALNADYPLRVAINSRTLISTLKEATSNNVRLTSKTNVLVYPFKPLIVRYEALRRYYDVVIQRCASGEIRQGKDENLDSANEGHANLHGITACSLNTCAHSSDRRSEEMGCLLNFVETELSDLLKIKNELLDGSSTKVEFENLWIFFKPEDTIVESAGAGPFERRAYQVLHVTGGRPIIDVANHSKHSDAERLCISRQNEKAVYGLIASRRSSDFVIDCFSMDYDGDYFGPRSHRFVILEYSGKRDINSLHVRPLDARDACTVEDLCQRGKRFVQLLGRKQRLVYHGQVL